MAVAQSARRADIFWANNPNGPFIAVVGIEGTDLSLYLFDSTGNPGNNPPPSFFQDFPNAIPCFSIQVP